MKPTPEFRRKMRLRSEELRRTDEIEWSFVRSLLREFAPEGTALGLPFDDRAWELWHRFRGALPFGWVDEWLPVCTAHAERYSAHSRAKEEAEPLSVRRLEIAARRQLGEVDTHDLVQLRGDLYLIARLALGIQDEQE